MIPILRKKGLRTPFLILQRPSRDEEDPLNPSRLPSRPHNDPPHHPNGLLIVSFFIKISSFLPGDHPYHAKCHWPPAFVARPALEQYLALDDVFQVSLSLFWSNFLHIDDIS